MADDDDDNRHRETLIKSYDDIFFFSMPLLASHHPVSVYIQYQFPKSRAMEIR